MSSSTPFLQQGIPHSRGTAEVAFVGDGQLTLDADGGAPILIAHGLADAATAGKIIDHAACVRMMTPAVPVAIELCAGSADGEDHKLQAGMGTVKGGYSRAKACTLSS